MSRRFSFDRTPSGVASSRTSVRPSTPIDPLADDPETTSVGLRPPRSGARPSENASSHPSSVRPPQHASLFREYELRIADAPPYGSVRGMFFSEILRLVPASSVVARPRYLPFSMYPVREFMHLLVAGARMMVFSQPPEDTIRQLGRSAYATFASRMVGISLLSGAGKDATSVLALLPRAYAMWFQSGSAELVSLDKGEAVVKLRDIWSFPESYHVGVWLGALDVLDLDGVVDVIRHSWCNVDLFVRWTARK